MSEYVIMTDSSCLCRGEEMKNSGQLYWNRKRVEVVKHYYYFRKSKIRVLVSGEEYIVNDCLLNKEIEYSVSISLLEGKNNYA